MLSLSFLATACLAGDDYQVSEVDKQGTMTWNRSEFEEVPRDEAALEDSAIEGSVEEKNGRVYFTVEECDDDGNCENVRYSYLVRKHALPSYQRRVEVHYPLGGGNENRLGTCRNDDHELGTKSKGCVTISYADVQLEQATHTFSRAHKIGVETSGKLFGAGVAINQELQHTWGEAQTWGRSRSVGWSEQVCDTCDCQETKFKVRVQVIAYFDVYDRNLRTKYYFKHTMPPPADPDTISVDVRDIDDKQNGAPAHRQDQGIWSKRKIERKGIGLTVERFEETALPPCHKGPTTPRDRQTTPGTTDSPGSSTTPGPDSDGDGIPDDSCLDGDDDGVCDGDGCSLSDYGVDGLPFGVNDVRLDEVYANPLQMISDFGEDSCGECIETAAGLECTCGVHPLTGEPAPEIGLPENVTLSDDGESPDLDEEQFVLVPNPELAWEDGISGVGGYDWRGGPLTWETPRRTDEVTVTAYGAPYTPITIDARSDEYSLRYNGMLDQWGELVAPLALQNHGAGAITVTAADAFADTLDVQVTHQESRVCDGEATP